MRSMVLLDSSPSLEKRLTNSAFGKRRDYLAPGYVDDIVRALLDIGNNMRGEEYRDTVALELREQSSEVRLSKTGRSPLVGSSRISTLALCDSATKEIIL